MKSYKHFRNLVPGGRDATCPGNDNAVYSLVTLSSLSDFKVEATFVLYLGFMLFCLVMQLKYITLSLSHFTLVKLKKLDGHSEEYARITRSCLLITAICSQ